MELALGTAQIGLAYGVNNAVGCLSDEEAAAVLAAAADNGFTMVDTSAEYGLAIARIAQFQEKRPQAFRMVMVRNLSGVASVYTAEEAAAVPDRIKMIQFPANMLDGRMDLEIEKQQRLDWKTRIDSAQWFVFPEEGAQSIQRSDVPSPDHGPSSSS